MGQQACFNDNPIFEVTRRDIGNIKKEAKNSSTGRYRICMHQSTDDTVQEMLIAMTKESRLIPHGRINKPRTYAIVEGEVHVVLFSESGEELYTVNLNENNVTYVRISIDHYILPIVKSDMAVLHEIIEGPFEGNDQYATWFNDELASKYYLS